MKKNFSFSKEDIAGYVEKHVRRSVERRIRFEVRKQVFRYLVLLFFALGLAFIVYFVLDLAVLLLELPLVFTNLLFGLFLLLVSLVLYIMR